MVDGKKTIEAAGRRAKERLLRNTWTAFVFLGTTGSFIGLLAFVLNVFDLEGPERLFFGVATGLTATLLVSGGYHLLFRREIVKELDDRIDLTFFGYGYSIFNHENSASIDEQHMYTYQKWVFDLTEDDLEYKTVLRGENWRRNPSNAIKIKLYGDVESSVDRMGFKAYQQEPLPDGVDKVELEPEMVGSSKTAETIIQIPFDEEYGPIKHGESFEIRYQVESLGNEVGKSEAVLRHVPAHRFKTNGKLEITVRTGGHEEEVEAAMAKVNSTTLLKSPGEITADDITFEDITDQLTDKDDLDKYEYSCRDCSEVLFLFRIRY